MCTLHLYPYFGRFLLIQHPRHLDRARNPSFYFLATRTSFGKEPVAGPEIFCMLVAEYKKPESMSRKKNSLRATFCYPTETFSFFPRFQGPRERFASAV